MKTLEPTQTQTGGSQGNVAPQNDKEPPTSKLTKEKPMFRKLKNRARQAFTGRIDINRGSGPWLYQAGNWSLAPPPQSHLNGFELNVTPEEIMSDLNFGVGSLWETAEQTAQVIQNNGVGAEGSRESN